MTENGEAVRPGGRHRGGSSSGLSPAVKADLSRNRESDAGRSSSSLNGRDSAKVRASGTGGEGGGGGEGGTSYVNGNSTPQMDEVNISIGEVDYTDGEMGSMSSSFSGSSPLSSVGSGGGGAGSAGSASSAGGGTRRVSSGSNVGSGASGGHGVGNSNGSAYKVRNKNNGRSAGSSSNGAGSQSGNNRGSSGTNGVQVIPGVAARPAGVPFGASALSKNMPNNGRGRPRGLRPRSSGSGTPGSATSSNQRVPSFSASSAVPPSSAGHPNGPRRSTDAGDNSSSRRGMPPNATFTEAEAAASEMVAPGVPVEVVVRAAVKIESVMRVLIARGYVRRKLVSEVTAFSLIMERGIEVVKHPFSGKGKAKNVTVNFVSRKGAMLLSWGGKSGVALETIFGVTKGIDTDALRAAVEPERADNCFSLHTNDRTIDFEVDNPWLVLLVVRALRLFLGAHYDTLPAPTFFSHLCVRPRSSNRVDTPKQTMVWTSVEKSPSSSSKDQQTTRSTPTERTSGDSASDEGSGGDGSGGGGGGGGEGGEGSGNGRRPSPWDGQDGDSDSGSALHDVTSSMESIRYPPPPDSQAPGAGDVAGPAAGTPPRVPKADEDGAPPADFAGDMYGEGDDETAADRSPGGVMALFSSGGRRVAEQISIGGPGGGPGSIPRSATSGVEGFSSSGGALSGGGEAGTPRAEGGAGAGEAEEPLTASQVLATRGMSKRLSLSKKLSAAANNNSGPLKGKRFDLMALPMDPAGQQDRRERVASEHVDTTPKRNQGMSISIGAGYDLPEEKHRDDSSEVETDVGRSGGGGHDSGRVAVVDDLNDKLQSLRKLCVPQARPTSFRPGRAPKTMAVKHMALFSGLGGSGKGGGSGGGGMGSVADMWGDGVRRQYQTDMVRQKNQSVEDVHKRDSVRTAMLVNRSGVHRVTRKAAPPESR